MKNYIIGLMTFSVIGMFVASIYGVAIFAIVYPLGAIVYKLGTIEEVLNEIANIEK